jgi:hypothetical protein
MISAEGGAAANTMTPAAQPERQVPEPDKKLAKEWQTRIDAALKRVKKKFDGFERNRALLAGRVDKNSDELVRANLHFANMAAMLPQVYAKDPEFAAKPTEAVDPEQLQAVKRFATTVELLLRKKVVKDGELKARSKALLRSGFTTSVGWLKASWQEKKGQDTLILNRLKDTQDNIDHVKRLLAETNDPSVKADRQTKLSELEQAVKGLQTPQEVTVSKGIALDFVMSEDIVIIDASVRAIGDYKRAAAMAHRVWMTPEQYKETFGYDCKKGKSYTEQNGAMASTDSSDKQATLLCVWEIWSQADNRIFYVCDGEDGFCREPVSPDWTGKRWYPFFLVAWNEVDGSFYPLSDIELTEKLVKEYNEQREDFVRDRRECLPINIARKGGSLTDDDLTRIKNRQGGDLIMVEGVGGQPVSNDIWSGQLGSIDPKNYDTTATRYDMERILGGSDTTTGSITKAKTLGEAQMLSQAVQSRNGDRRDTLEDMLNELGPFCVEVMLRKFSPEEVQKIAGPAAVWPSLAIEDIFDMVTIEVRGGSTGKPDKAMEQETWSKLLPIINEAVAKIAELRTQGQVAMSDAVIELVRETLRRFDERIDIEQFLPQMPEGEDDPALLKQQNVELKTQLDEATKRLQEAIEKVEKGFISAAATIATSANPPLASEAFTQLLGMPLPDVQAMLAAGGAQLGADPGDMPPEQVPQPEGAMPPQADEIPPQPPEPSLPQQ